jgi:hypothetical protein
MSTIDQPSALTKDAVAIAVTAAYATDGYLTPDGERDNKAVAEAIFTHVTSAVVQNLGERASKAITRGALVRATFPSLPPQSDWAASGDPELAEAVWEAIQLKVWSLAAPDTHGAVQKLIGVRLEHHLLTRYLLGDDRTPAVYVTADLKCLTEDFAAPLGAALSRVARKMATNLAMATHRQPENAKAFERILKKAGDTAALDARVQLQLGTAGITADGDNGDA